MKVIDAGHLYEVQNVDNPDSGQRIQFIEKTSQGQNFVTVNDGTTNEELLEVLIDRTKTLNDKFPCRENSLAITKMQEALFWFNERTKDRQKRNVEGKAIK